MPKNRHLTFGDMQAQKSREQHLAKLRAMMKPAEEEQPGSAETPAASAAPKNVPATASAGKSTPTKKAAKPAPKKAAKKAVAKKKGKK